MRDSHSFRGEAGGGACCCLGPRGGPTRVAPVAGGQKVVGKEASKGRPSCWLTFPVGRGDGRALGTVGADGRRAGPSHPADGCPVAAAAAQGAPPPLPHHVQTSGVGRLVAAVVLVGLALAVFGPGLRGPAVAVTVADDVVVRWLGELHVPGLEVFWQGWAYGGSWWTLTALESGLLLGSPVLRRWRHLPAGGGLAAGECPGVRPGGNYRAAATAIRGESANQLGRLGDAGGGGRDLCGRAGRDPVHAGARGPMAQHRQVGRGRAGGAGRCRLDRAGRRRPHRRTRRGGHRGDHPPAGFPLVYPQRGVPGHLPAGPGRPPGRRRGPRPGDPPGPRRAARPGRREVKPFGLASSAGSTPLRITVGDPPASSCSPSCTPSPTCAPTAGTSWAGSCCTGGWRTKSRSAPSGGWSSRRTTRCADAGAGLPSPAPYGFVELTPEREYLLVTEFFDGAVELGEAEADNQVIDDGLGIIRKLWDAGLAHRDVKPGNLLVRDGRLLLIDVAFAETRPSPWRQAVDLANMMLCLALNSSADQVYQRALRQFRVEEVTEGFAAARGLALPSQLRRMLRAQGRDLHAEFTRPPPTPPQPISPALGARRMAGGRRSCSALPWPPGRDARTATTGRSRPRWGATASPAPPWSRCGSRRSPSRRRRRSRRTHRPSVDAGRGGRQLWPCGGRRPPPSGRRRVRWWPG